MNGSVQPFPLLSPSLLENGCPLPFIVDGSVSIWENYQVFHFMSNLNWTSQNEVSLFSFTKKMQLIVLKFVI